MTTFHDKTRAAVLGVLYVFVSANTTGAEQLLHVTVSAGKHDRISTPIQVDVSLSKDMAKVSEVGIVYPSGRLDVGQLTAPGLLSKLGSPNKGQVWRELHFTAPALKAGESLSLTVISYAQKPRTKTFAWNDTPGKYAELSFAGRPVLRYMYEPLDSSTKQRRMETYKVFHHVYDPQGKRYLTKGPGGLYSHHRGLFYGYNNIRYGEDQRADTWHCGHGEYQSHEGFLASEAGPVLGRHRLAIDWHGRDGKVFAKEQRELTAYHVVGGLLIEASSRLVSTVGKLNLDGDPQHAGFQFRGSQEIPDKTKTQTYYLRPDGKDKPGSFRNWPANKDHVNLPFNAMSFVLGEQRYTCCYLDHPSNPRPTRFSERDYGRFGAYAPYELDEGKTLPIQYRFWLQEGEMTVQQVTALGNNFAEPPQVTVKPL